jgi:hypothetical protein
MPYTGSKIALQSIDQIQYSELKNAIHASRATIAHGMMETYIIKNSKA